MIEFEVLGGVRLRVDGAEVDLAPMPQRLLGLLLAKRGQSVKVDTMIDALWEHDPPRTARKTVRIYVYRLRALIGDESRIVRADSGYRLNLKPEELDAARFEQLTTQAAQARSRGDLEAALCLLDKALGLWRGPAFDGLDRVAEVSTLVSWLDERRLTAFEDRVDIELELGRHAEAIGPLTRAVAENPYRERLRGQLMRALHRSGRQAEALDAYRQVRQLLATEMGMEPHEELQAIHREVLGQVPTVGQVPRHLPHDVPDFVGRQQDLEWLDSMAGARGTPLVITAVAGAGGIGKTALVLHWAHRVAELFPDGQLYVNLRGYDSGSPLRPLDALAHLLRCLGVQRGQVPSEVEVASALYRSLLAERKMLVVLDNACSAEQVRPLLPGVAGCRVVVTSRDRLSGLVAGDGARRLTLGLLPDDNGLALMRRLLGGQRVDAEPEAAARVVALCAGLPLALRIAAAKLADWPAMSLAEYAGDLSDGNRLAALALGGDEERAVTVVIDRSHDSLPAAAQRALRLLGLVPGPEFTAEALAALAGTSVAEAASNLDALA
ncbi:MAG TPA: BTAD domain-containing putative transcriptional regulator, partial [Candidatus Limnocylindrales bacterium]